MPTFPGLVQFARQLCSSVAHTHSFITTPIFYVNAAPHIGHLYSAVLADAAHRWQILKGVECTVFSTGTDEHGLKVQKAATTQGCAPIELCNSVSQKFRDLFTAANISYTDYIRTTESRHVTQVEQFWKTLYDRGYIYKGKYEGWYSVSDETFLSASQVTDGVQPGTKVSLESGHLVEWSSEENYLFRLTAFQEDLLKWINSPPYPVVPEMARKQVHKWVVDELNSDLSVSRPRSRLSWGIPVPNDNTQTIYVWLDALVNYLTVSNYPKSNHTWPATVHIVGKDILRFHAVYWPAFLLAAGLELPKKVVTHAHWTMGKTKMSKSKGNVVDPFQQMDKFGIDPLRYFLLKESTIHNNGDYSEERIGQSLNADLADTYGNLLQRVTAKKLNPDGPGLKFSADLFPLNPEQTTATRRATAEDYELVESLNHLPEKVERYFEEFEFNKGINAIFSCIHQTNQFLERHKPWELVRQPAEKSWLHTVLSIAVESLRLCSCLLYPVTPDASMEVLHRLGFTQTISSRDLRFKLQGAEGIETLEACTTKMKLGGRPLFTKIS